MGRERLGEVEEVEVCGRRGASSTSSSILFRWLAKQLESVD